MPLEETIEQAVKTAIGDQALNNIVLSVKLQASEEENATLKARVAELEARPEPLDTMADLDLQRGVLVEDGAKAKDG